MDGPAGPGNGNLTWITPYYYSKGLLSMKPILFIGIFYCSHSIILNSSFFILPTPPFTSTTLSSQGCFSPSPPQALAQVSNRPQLKTNNLPRTRNKKATKSKSPQSRAMIDTPNFSIHCLKRKEEGPRPTIHHFRYR